MGKASYPSISSSLPSELCKVGVVSTGTAIGTAEHGRQRVHGIGKRLAGNGMGLTTSAGCSTLSINTIFSFNIIYSVYIRRLAIEAISVRNCSRNAARVQVGATPLVKKEAVRTVPWLVVAATHRQP